MKLNNIRLLVKDFDTCFTFYSQKVGLTATWGKHGGDYASFDIGIENKMGFSIFKSDLMAAALGNADRLLPENCREKALVVMLVDSVDEAYQRLSGNGVEFVTEPKDMTGWGSRVAHFKDPEGNLIEICSELPKDKWDNDLQEESKEYDS